MMEKIVNWFFTWNIIIYNPYRILKRLLENYLRKQGSNLSLNSKSHQMVVFFICKIRAIKKSNIKPAILLILTSKKYLNKLKTIFECFSRKLCLGIQYMFFDDTNCRKSKKSIFYKSKRNKLALILCWENFVWVKWFYSLVKT